MTEILINRIGPPELAGAIDGSFIVTVPMRIKRCGLRKSVTLPDADGLQYHPWDTEPTPLQLALARGHRWLVMLESDEASSVQEIVRRESVDDAT
jgi:hypothetical protein